MNHRSIVVGTTQVRHGSGKRMRWPYYWNHLRTLYHQPHHQPHQQPQQQQYLPPPSFPMNATRILQQKQQQQRQQQFTCTSIPYHQSQQHQYQYHHYYRPEQFTTTVNINVINSKFIPNHLCCLSTRYTSPGVRPFCTATRNSNSFTESILTSTQRYYHSSLYPRTTTTTTTTTDDTKSSSSPPPSDTADDSKAPEIADTKESTTDTTISSDQSNVGKELPKESVGVETSTEKVETPNEKVEEVKHVTKEVVHEKKELKMEEAKPTKENSTPEETKPSSTSPPAEAETATAASPDATPAKGKGKEGKQPHRDKKQANSDPANKKLSSDSTTEASSSSSSSSGIRKVDVAAISPSLEGGPPIVDGVRQYSTPEITRDAKFHKTGLSDPTRPDYQNPLHHNNPNLDTRFFREDFATEEEFQAAILPAPPLDNPDGTPSYPKYLHDLADDMVHLTMLEMNELLNRMADHYGFHEGILSPEGAGDGNEDGSADDDDDSGGGGGAAKAEAEKTAFDVKLVSYDASVKIKIIKEVRVVIPGLGLKEAKELVEGAPVVLQKGVSKEVAEQSKEKLVALGAVIEIV